ncbi:hypothetical protein GIB67_024342 [Kingdonia uniflora]|uniref:Uncharacterized protein n=1 Tax=Kingdonia uniflora TaxID=39325 RepID=A0A7J7LFB7_9MAGN|nr:hypothetical protein GIB67_024342 [Kingdonia uniflora]
MEAQSSLMEKELQGGPESNDEYYSSSPSEYTSNSGASEDEELLPIKGVESVERIREPFPVKLGEEFNDAKEFHSVFIDTSIRVGFEIKFIKSAKKC